jgi:GT2 family glycosyltransferase
MNNKVPKSVGAVILTMGTRPDELQRALHSLKMQRGIELDLVIVGNGWNPAKKYPEENTLFLEENLGIPAGRNAGVSKVSGEYLFFLDDDAYFDDPHALSLLVEKLENHGEWGLIQPRVVPESTGETPNRWIPRLRIGDPNESSPATTLWEGAVIIRRQLFDSIGGWPSNFFYAHEGIELVWQVYNKGSIAWYAADVTVRHPVINPTRHLDFYRLNARNRVWLAKRNLPFPVSLIYVIIWTLISLLRMRKLSALVAWIAGFFNGIFTSAGAKKKLSWRALMALGKAGRFPII